MCRVDSNCDTVLKMKLAGMKLSRPGTTISCNQNRGVQKAAVTGILNQAAESGRFHILEFGATTNFF